MNRLDRLFGLVVLLQAKRRVRAADLAAAFGVSQRTVYRDVAALSEAGVPVVSLPGEGYELMAGFFLPPLVFSPAEATALSLGARLLARQATGRIAEGATRALAKIAAVLPAPTREEVNRLSEVVDFFADPGRFDLDDPRLAALQRAVRERRVLRLRYHDYARSAIDGFAGGSVTERDVEPRRLLYSSGRWYLNAYCRLRGAPRDFRLERIEALAETGEAFAPRDSAPPAPAPAPVTVRVRVPAAMVRWVRERQHYGLCAEDPAPDGGLVVTYQMEALTEVLPWLRSWGPAVEVLSPPELRAQVREEAEQVAALLAAHDPPGSGEGTALLAAHDPPGSGEGTAGHDRIAAPTPARTAGRPSDNTRSRATEAAP